MHFNPQQSAVIEATEGAVCVDACAGTGKTATIVERYARLIERGVHPGRLLLLTFTVKAANEMSERMERRVGTKLPWSMNFHRLCVRLMRLYPEFGMPKNFTILDTKDRDAMIKRISAANGIKAESKFIDEVIAQVDRTRLVALGYLQGPPNTIAANRDSSIRVIAGEYETAIEREGKLDFDKIIQHVIWSFRRDPALVAKVAARWDYVTVDEAQDTDRAQFELMTFLAPHGNIALVGDMDQSIYGFRGAEYENLRRFVERYQARRLPLEINYRSSAGILTIANKVIAENKNRFQKTMRPTVTAAGSNILLQAPDSDGEAKAIAAMIKGAIQAGEDPGGIAVLYRVGGLSRLVEQALTRAVIPYRIVGGLRFWERAEVKSVIAYARIVLGSQDPESWRRATSTPPIGIGDKMWGEILGAPDPETGIEKYGKGKAKAWLEKVRCARGAVDDALALDALLDRIGFRDAIKASKDDGANRLSNVNEAITAIKEFPSLQEFVDDALLGLPGKEAAGEDRLVTLSTIHAAKGLEWRRVFVIGVVEDVLPHVWSTTDREVEEERRLFYVAVTRAKNDLTITFPRMVAQRGTMSPGEPSRFLKAVEGDLQKMVMR